MCVFLGPHTGEKRRISFYNPHLFGKKIGRRENQVSRKKRWWFWIGYIYFFWEILIGFLAKLLKDKKEWFGLDKEN